MENEVMFLGHCFYMYEITVNSGSVRRLLWLHYTRGKHKHRFFCVFYASEHITRQIWRITQSTKSNTSARDERDWQTRSLGLHTRDHSSN